jgi:hypothetical protein
MTRPPRLPPQLKKSADHCSKSRGQDLVEGHSACTGAPRIGIDQDGCGATSAHRGGIEGEILVMKYPVKSPMKYCRSLAALAAALSISVFSIGEAAAACTRLAFSVNDYGKEGPTRDAKNLLDKYIARWTAERNIKRYTVGPKSVKCELFIDLIVFDEYTCRAEANVCWSGPLPPGHKSDGSATGPSLDRTSTKAPPQKSSGTTPAPATAATPAKAAPSTAISTGSVKPAPTKAAPAPAAAPAAEQPAVRTPAAAPAATPIAAPAVAAPQPAPAPTAPITAAPVTAPPAAPAAAQSAN